MVSALHPGLQLVKLILIHGGRLRLLGAQQGAVGLGEGLVRLAGALQLRGQRGDFLGGIAALLLDLAFDLLHVRLQRADLHLVGVGLGGGDGLRLRGERSRGGLFGVVQILFQPVVHAGQLRHGGVEFLDALVGLGEVGLQLLRVVPAMSADGPGLLELFAELDHLGLRRIEVAAVGVHEAGHLLVVARELVVLRPQVGSFAGRLAQAAVLLAQGRHFARLVLRLRELGAQGRGVGRRLLGGRRVLFQAVVGGGEFGHGGAALLQRLVRLGQLLLQVIERGRVRRRLALRDPQLAFQRDHAGLRRDVAVVFPRHVAAEFFQLVAQRIRIG